MCSGVRDGSTCGPLLFLIDINDLPHSISSRMQFSDDCITCLTITDSDDHTALQNDLNLALIGVKCGICHLNYPNASSFPSAASETIPPFRMS